MTVDETTRQNWITLLAACDEIVSDARFDRTEVVDHGLGTYERVSYAGSYGFWAACRVCDVVTAQYDDRFGTPLCDDCLGEAARHCRHCGLWLTPADLKDAGMRFSTADMMGTGPRQYRGSCLVCCRWHVLHPRRNKR